MNSNSKNSKNVSGVAVLIVALILTLSGCANTKLKPGAESVRRLGAQEASDCTRLGSTHAQVLSKILFFDRSEKKMSEELTTLARNSATNMGGNVVIAEGEIASGEQTFGVYRCPN
jgi:hypothetical protein